RIKGRLYDAYRQSWVASPEPSYVAAGNTPLRAPVSELQTLLDARPETVDVAGKLVPAVASGLVEAERLLLQSRGLLSSNGKITPWVITKDKLDTPEKLLAQELWDAIYGVPKGISPLSASSMRSTWRRIMASRSSTATSQPR